MNPYLKLNKHIPDSEPRIFDNKLYIFGSQDSGRGDLGYCPYDYEFQESSLDKIEFQSKGYSVKKIDMLDLVKPNDVLQAPDVVKGVDGRYYCYYNSMFNMNCGVAVSDHPLGPYKYLGQVMYKGKPYTKIKMFDPAVLVDGDKIYIYVGFTPAEFSIPGVVIPPYSFVAELEPDMITLKEEPRYLIPGPTVSKGTSFEGHAFYEASSIRKINDIYYFIYSSELSHDLSYATSKYPDKDFTYQGMLISNCNIGYKGNTIPELPYGNTHGSVCYINDEWYVFYHRHTSGNACARQPMVDKIHFENGKFSQAEMTSLGFDKSLPIGKEINATYACYLVSKNHPNKLLKAKDSDMGPAFYEVDENTHYIHHIIDETKIGYKYFDLNGKYEVSLKVSAQFDGIIEILFDKDEYPIAECKACNGIANFDFEFYGRTAMFFNFKTNSEVIFYSLIVKEKSN